MSALEQLNRFSKNYPDIGTLIADCHLNNGKSILGYETPLRWRWPAECFLPTEAWVALSVNVKGFWESPDVIADYTFELATFGAWRYTQGIYRIDSFVRKELENTELKGKLPFNVLSRLPQWCIYIETPDMFVEEGQLEGFFATILSDSKAQKTSLVLVLDLGQETRWMKMDLDGANLAGIVDRMISDPNSCYSYNREDLTRELSLILSMLFFVCSREPDIEKEGGGEAPRNPAFVKTKKGKQLFPPKKPTFWNIGDNTGRALKSSVSSQGMCKLDDKNPPRSHVRRAHWHGYWKGRRGGAREFIYHWIHPLLVTGRCLEAAESRSVG